MEVQHLDGGPAELLDVKLKVVRPSTAPTVYVPAVTCAAELRPLERLLAFPNGVVYLRPFGLTACERIYSPSSLTIWRSHRSLLTHSHHLFSSSTLSSYCLRRYQFFTDPYYHDSPLRLYWLPTSMTLMVNLYHNVLPFFRGKSRRF
jgi:hypothetical protein